VFSTARSEILAYLFPTRADFIRMLGKEAGVELGRAVAGKFIVRSKHDGADY
jgi:hypothetical protein